jgi:hypothetical protein
VKAVLIVAMLLLGVTAPGQIAAPLEVTVSQPLRDAGGAILPGANPYNSNAVPGCAVRILSAGTNGIPDAPAPDGSATGDDVELFATRIGYGISPDLARPGRFDGSFLPAPAVGLPVFVRVFDAPVPAAASHYGQTPAVPFASLSVIDASRLGLLRIRQPLRPTSPDADGDGYTDQEEWLANTDPLNAGDHPGAFVFRFIGGDVSQAGDTLAAPEGEAVELPAGSRRITVTLPVRPGRHYRLERAPSLDAGAWSTVAEVTDVDAEQEWVLTDEEPPGPGPLFYRLRISLPEGVP